jgi:hypothetical protein
MPSRTEFVTDAKGKRVAVLLDLKSYARLTDAAEELEDIRAYDKARPVVLDEVKRGQFVTLASHLKKRAVSAK